MRSLVALMLCFLGLLWLCLLLNFLCSHNIAIVDGAWLDQCLDEWAYVPEGPYRLTVGQAAPAPAAAQPAANADAGALSSAPHQRQQQELQGFEQLHHPALGRVRSQTLLSSTPASGADPSDMNTIPATLENPSSLRPAGVPYSPASTAAQPARGAAVSQAVSGVALGAIAEGAEEGEAAAGTGADVNAGADADIADGAGDEGAGADADADADAMSADVTEEPADLTEEPDDQDPAAAAGEPEVSLLTQHMLCVHARSSSSDTVPGLGCWRW